jgi:transposase InsO family protein
LNINKSAYSYWLNTGRKTTECKLELYHAIIEVYTGSNGIYGAPKITNILNQRGFDCSVSKVSRAMKTLGIMSIVTKKFRNKKSSLTGEEKSLIINLIKGLNIKRVNQVWTTDISYIKTKKQGNFYLIAYIDYYSKKVVAWNLATEQNTEQVVDVLKQAVQRRTPSPGLIIHSDKGVQMRSNKYRDYLAKNHFVFSYTSLNHSCDENAAHESFHAALKKECIYQKEINKFHDAYLAIYEYIENFYNPIRIHSSIGYMSPNDFEKNW